MCRAGFFACPGGPWNIQFWPFLPAGQISVRAAALPISNLRRATLLFSRMLLKTTLAQTCHECVYLVLITYF